MNDRAQSQHTIALTGATGFVGQHTLDLLLDRGHSVRALCRQAQHKMHPHLTWIDGSLQNQTALEQMVSGVDCVIHIAGTIKASSRASFFEGNEQGTANLVDAMSQTEAPPHMVHLSSLAARDPHLSAYAASKRAAETVVQAYQGGSNAVILRPSAVYGPGDMETLFYFKSAVAAFAAVPGKGSHRTSLIHVQDLANALVALAEQNVRIAEPLSIDDGKEGGYAVEEVLDLISPDKRRTTLYLPYAALWGIAAIGSLFAGLAGKTPMLTTGKARELCHDDWVCNRPSLNETGFWSPQIEGQRGLQQTLAWYEENSLV